MCVYDLGVGVHAATLCMKARGQQYAVGSLSFHFYGILGIELVSPG